MHTVNIVIRLRHLVRRIRQRHDPGPTLGINGSECETSRLVAVESYAQIARQFKVLLLILAYRNQLVW
jgi:hypothetical protein